MHLSLVVVGRDYPVGDRRPAAASATGARQHPRAATAAGDTNYRRMPDTRADAAGAAAQHGRVRDGV